MDPAHRGERALGGHLFRLSDFGIYRGYLHVDRVAHGRYRFIHVCVERH